MDIGVLGPLTLNARDGRAVAVAGHRQRLLLALLAQRVGRTVAPDVLVEALWGDDLPANPTGALHSQVSRLRRCLADAGGGLAGDPGGYRLVAEEDALDAARFEARLEAPPDEPAADAVVRLRSAIELWRGPAFVEFADVDELRIEGGRLDELRLVAEERLGEALVADGRATEAVALLEALVETEPFRESAIAALMRAHVAAGRTGEALRAFQAYRGRVGDELGLEPSIALRRLEAEVVRGDDPAGEAPTLEQMVVGYATSGRRPQVRLAVGRVGSGPPIVVVPAWVTSLEVTASSRDPRSALLERLAAHAEVVTYDQPGTGLSGGPVEDFSLDASADDLSAVIEHLDRGPVALVATSAAGPTALRVAAARPELVDRLVLFGTFGDPRIAFPNPAFSEALVDLVRSNWATGSTMITQLYRPGASDEAVRRLSGVLRDATTAEVGVAYLRATLSADASDVLDDVRQPALVIHYRGDKVVPFAGGEHLAARLPAARFVPLDGRYHLPDIADVERLDRAIAAFVAEAR